MKLVIFSVVAWFILTLSACSSLNTSLLNSSDRGSDNTVGSSKSQEINFGLYSYCKSHHCRKDKQIRLQTHSGLIEKSLPLYWPVIMKDRLSILPGDKLLIEVDIRKKQLVNFKLVERIVKPKKTLTIDFEQMPGKVDMILKVSSPFKKALSFNVEMIDFQGGVHTISTCPIVVKKTQYEHWPYAIPELLISNLRLSKAKASALCQ